MFQNSSVCSRLPLLLGQQEWVVKLSAQAWSEEQACGCGHRYSPFCACALHIPFVLSIQAVSNLDAGIVSIGMQIAVVH